LRPCRPHDMMPLCPGASRTRPQPGVRIIMWKKSSKKTGRIPSGLYTETHCHLLPGVDDGVKDWEGTRRSLALARREKVRSLILTPHIRPEIYPNAPKGLEERFEEWRYEAGAGDLEVRLGCEAFFHHGLPDAWSRGDLLPLDDRSRYLLVELPSHYLPRGVSDVLYNLRLQGVEPVLAHPERLAFAQRDLGRLRKYAENETPFQVTTHSVTGALGAAAQKACLKILENGWGSVFASDAHAPDARPPMFREAVRFVSSRYGRKAARRLFIENPARLARGEGLLPVTCTPRKRRLFSRR